MLLRRRVLKVYPYAQLASKRFTTLKERLERIDKRHQKKRYAKRIEKYLEGEFSEELKKLTRKEGQILVKLMRVLPKTLTSQQLWMDLRAINLMIDAIHLNSLVVGSQWKT